MAISWLFYNNLQKKTQCVGFLTKTFKTKHNTDEAISFARSQKKLAINRLEVGIRMSWVEKTGEGGGGGGGGGRWVGHLLDTQE